MSSPCARRHFNKYRVAISILVCLICIFSNTLVAHSGFNNVKLNPVVVSKLPTVIHIGTRTAASAIGTYDSSSNQVGGFCGLFEQELRNQLRPYTKVTNRKIKNQYLDRDHPRFAGLLTEVIEDKIDIECGPNSISSGELLDPSDADGIRFLEKISFSKEFYTTGIKFLLRKSITVPPNNILPIDIGVVRNTTTLEKFLAKGIVPKDFPTRAQALASLRTEGIEVYASDALILQTLLEEGIKGDDSEEYQPAFIKDGYTLFPPKARDYLPGYELEKYAIAVKKNTDYRDELLKVINSTIDVILERPILDNVERDQANLDIFEEEASTPKPPGVIQPPAIDSTLLTVLILLVLVVLGIIVLAIVALLGRSIIHQHGSGDNVGGDKAERDKIINRNKKP